jgi:hypothetical protein
MNIKALLIAVCVFFCTSIAHAAPVVAFNTSGSAGAWQVNFSILNTLGGTNNIYFFGVQAPTVTNSGFSSPVGWNVWNGGAAWNTGSAVYNNNWITGSSASTSISPGQTLGGFNVLFNTVAAPTSISWFAYAYGGTYNGTDTTNLSVWNPGFEGIATVATAVAPVPEPETYAMLLVGLGLLGFTARRRKFTGM